MMVTSTINNQSGDPLTFEKLISAIKTLPKPHEFWSWNYAPSDKAIQFEDDIGKVTIAHPTVWMRVEREVAPITVQANPLALPLSQQVVEMDGDNPLSCARRKRLADFMTSAFKDQPNDR